MSFYFIVCLLGLTVCVSARSFRPILLEITESGRCKNDPIFSNFDLTDIPQFGAMCNLPPPKIDQFDFLLDNNVVPILCMGVFDVFQRFCQSTYESNLFPSTKDSLPSSSDKFSELFNVLNKSEEFSSLDTFCSHTVLNSTTLESSSNISMLWWQKLNSLLKEEKSCRSVCRTNDKNKVQPLCSFIIYSNLISLRNKNQQETNSKLDGIKAISASDNQQRSHEADSNQISLLTVTSANDNLKPSIVPTPSYLSNPSSMLDNTHQIDNLKKNISVKAVPKSPMNDQNTLDSKLNKNADLDQNFSKVDSFTETKTSPSAVATEDSNKLVDSKESLTKDIATSINKEETNYKPGLYEPNDDVNVKRTDKNIQNKVAVEENMESPDKIENEVGDSESPQVPLPDEFDNGQPISDKTLQTSFTGEDIEDGDGDDIDTEVEIAKAKLAQNQTDSSAGKSGVVAIEAGEGEPDKAYGEGEVLIEDHFIEAEDSHFFTYFMCMIVLTIMAYLAFHNKKKLVALALEGRRTRGSRRRPNSSNYSKLDCNLEEALVSNNTATVTHVLY